MPALAAVIPAVGGIASSLIGGSTASKASKTLSKADTAAYNQVENVVQGGEKNIGEQAANAAGGVVNAANQGVGTVNDATAKANSLLGNLYGGEQQALNPYLAAGQTGVNALNAGFQPGGQFTNQFAFDPTQIANNPNYQFTLQLGLQATQRAQAAQGQGLGGGALKALTQYSQGLATNTINDAYNQALTTFQTNRNNALSGLTTLSNIGQGATNSLLNATQNFGNQSAANTLNAGYYSANTPLQAAEYAGNVNNAAAQFGANYNLQGNEQALNYFTNGANATPAGQVQQGNMWNSLLGGASTLGSIFANPAAYGGFGQSGSDGVQGTPGYTAPTAFSMPPPITYTAVPPQPVYTGGNAFNS